VRDVFYIYLGVGDDVTMYGRVCVVCWMGVDAMTKERFGLK